MSQHCCGTSGFTSSSHLPEEPTRLVANPDPDLEARHAAVRGGPATAAATAAAADSVAPTHHTVSRNVIKLTVLQLNYQRSGQLV